MSEEQEVHLESITTDEANVEVKVGFVCPVGCPNQGNSPTISVKQQPNDRSLGLKAVLAVFSLIVIAWIFRIVVDKKAPTPIEYGLAAVALISLTVAPVETKDLSLTVLKVAVEKIAGNPQTVSVVVSHLVPPAEHEQTDPKSGG